MLPTLKAVVGADVGPMTICETVVGETIGVDGTIGVDRTVPGSVAVFGVPAVPALAPIVTVGTPATDEHTASYARNEKCMNNP